MSELLGVSGIQSRMAELAELVSPQTSDTASSSSEFSTLLSDAAASSALSSASSDSSTSSSSLLSSLLGTSDSSSSSSSLLSSLLGTSSSSLSSTTLAALLAKLQSSTSSSTSAVTAQDFVSQAEKYLGTPYVWGGDSLSEGGLDCSGLVVRALNDLGVSDVPRTAKQQASYGTAVDSLADAEPGDLLIFNNGTHVAIYLGNNQMIESPKPGGSVRETTVWATPTQIRRVLPQESQTTTTSASDTASAQRTALLSLIGASA